MDEPKIIIHKLFGEFLIIYMQIEVNYLDQVRNFVLLYGFKQCDISSWIMELTTFFIDS